MSILGDGTLAAIFYGPMSAIYPDGVLTIVQMVDTGGGDFTATPTQTPIKVQRDVCTHEQRQAEGYTDGDVRLIVLQPNVPAGISTDSFITTQGKDWFIYNIEQDPASAYWYCAGRIKGNP